MSRFDGIIDPADLDGLRASIERAPRAVDLVPLGIRTLDISPAAAERVSDAVAEELRITGNSSDRPKVVLLTDSTRILRDGLDLKSELEERLSDRFDVERLILGHDSHLLADDDALDRATESVKDADCVVTVGSGTITDIGKVASHRNENLPLVVVQTAASVDGFTDNVSVVLKRGVKRTIPSRWPNVVLADTTTIAQAPSAMNVAGFGEVLSLYTGPADWQLSSIFGMDSTFHETPRDLLLAFAGDAREWATGVDVGELAAITQLTRVLAIRGVGTGIAGTTACLSGVEHVISHMLDMYSSSHGLPVGLHGAQVGVASLIGAAAWGLFLEKIAEGLPELRFPAGDEIEAHVLSVFAWCDPTGQRGAECWSDYSEKLAKWRGNRSGAQDVIGDWPRHQADLQQSLPSSGMLASALRSAGAPSTPHQLDDWVSPEVWRWAVANCLFMRNRLTVIDVLYFSGWWTDEDVDLVITRAALAAEERA